ncbi:hypothetical protein GTC050_23570 [Burkholderia pseudomallei]|nr:hypothetical protein GTC050_23570 [Burkholderia pseudomallei]
MKASRPVTPILIKRNAERVRACCIVDRSTPRPRTVGADVPPACPHDTATFAAHALIIDPLIEQAKRETLNDIHLRPLDGVPRALVATLIALQTGKTASA